MSERALAETSEHLEAFATLNGRTRCNLFVYERGKRQQPMLAEDLNLADSARRGIAIGSLPECFRSEAETLLSQLAAKVAAERSTPKPKSTPAQASQFPDVEPWNEEVDGAELLDNLLSLLAQYVVLPKHTGEALALWTVHSYVTDVTDYTPYILVTSPVRECGKTTLLEILGKLAHRPKFTGGITAAALYRQIERHSPVTMLLDELDARLRGDGGEALRAVLNTGFQRNGVITICVGDQHEDRDFRTFCPKVLAGIGRVWDTVTSRSIPVRLNRASREQLAGLTKIRGDRIDATCLPYRRRLLRWTADVRDSLTVTDAVTPTELGARQCDVWRPLLAIADVAGGHWPTTARAAALALHGMAQEEGDYGLLLLEDLRGMFGRHGTDALFSKAILEELAQREDRPWPEYSRDKPITARGIARLLGRFEVKPRTVRIGQETQKGYSLDDLASVFRTYLPALHTPDPSVTSVTTQSGEGSPRTVTDVTDRKGGYGHEEELEREAIQAEGAA